MTWVSLRRWLVAATLWAVTVGTLPAQAPQRPPQMPTLPLTQLAETPTSADLDNRSLSLSFDKPQPVHDVLLALVRGTNLSVAADSSLGGTFVGELRNVTVRQGLALVLGPLGLDYSVDGSFVRVFRRERQTRFFDIDYLPGERAASSKVGGATASSSALVTTSVGGDVFADLTKGVQSLLSDRATFSVDRKAGLLQATDYPERLDRVAAYLDAVQDRMQRQAQIEATVVEIELNDDKAPGVNWQSIAQQLAVAPGEAAQGPRRSALTSLRITDASRLLAALGDQGTVTVVASPRVTTLNNEPAVVRTDAVTLSVTPQISGDAFVTLSVTPIVTAPAPVESDMLARVADGETLVVSGFVRDRETRERRAVGRTGGWFGRGTVVARKRVELVVLLTPRILSGVVAQ